MSDLFDLASPAPVADAPAPPSAPAVETYPPPPNMHWARRLTAAGPIDTFIMVAIRWTGVVVEDLCLGDQGRWFLFADGKIQEVKADPGARHRTVFMEAQAVWEMHMRRPMIAVTVGTHAVTYRFAKPGEPVPDLPLPRGEGHG
jgi:hypothetical protein